MAYYGYLTPIPSFNMESSVTTDSFMWKQTLRTARLANAKKNFFLPQAASGHPNELLIERLKNGT